MLDLSRRIASARGVWHLRLRGVSYRGAPAIFGPAPVLNVRGGKVQVGERLVIRSAVYRAGATCAPGAELTIGDDVFLNQGASIYAAKRVTIGSHALIGDLVCIYDTDFHQVRPDAPRRCEPVTVGRNVWIGRGALLLPGVTVGDHAVVAAASVVTGEVPPRSVVAGNPARVVSTFEADDSWVRV